MKAKWSLVAAAFLVGYGCSGDEGPDAAQPVADSGMPAEDAGDTADAGVDGGETTPDSGAPDAGPRDAGEIDPVTEPFRTLRSSGPPANRIDLVIVGDGYLKSELATTYTDHADRLGFEMFQRRNGGRDVTQPFRRYQSYFNVHRVHLASTQSGIDDPDNAVAVDTALDGSLRCEDPVAGPCHVDFAKVDAAIRAALAGTDIVPDWRAVVLNTTERLGAVVQTPDGPLVIYGGGYGSGNQAYRTRELALRELAVAYAGAGYETVGAAAYFGAEPEEINLTADADGPLKWARWDGYDVMGDGIGAVGRYEGGGGYLSRIYRPTEDSKMGAQEGINTLGYNAVVREALILAMYDRITLIETHTSTTSTLDNPDLLDIGVAGTVLEVEWTVDDVVVPDLTATRFGFSAWANLESLPGGTYTVRARVNDPTSWVRIDPRTPLEATIEWQVNWSP